MKKTIHPATKRWIGIGTVTAALTLCATLHAALQIPYTANASTLHLWHLDDPDGLYATDAVATSSITLTNLGMPTAGTLPYTNVNLGVPSALGQGTCLRGATKQHLLYGGAFSDVSQFCDPVTGAFTFEALVKFDVNPLAAMDAQIVAGDNGGGHYHPGVAMASLQRPDGVEPSGRLRLG